MSALTVVQNVCRRLGLPVPNAAASSNDPQIRQLFSLATEEGQDLSSRIAWRALVQEFTFTTVAAESQGEVETFAPGYKWLTNQTLQDRTQQLPVYGPLDSAQWQMLKARQVVGPYSQYTIRGGEMLFIPAPPAGHTIAGEYLTSHWVRDAGSTTTRDSYEQDDDVALLDETLIELGVRWRWLEAKGFTYGESFASYERRVNNAIARDGTKPILNTSGGGQIGPGMVVQEGNWNL